MKEILNEEKTDSGQTKAQYLWESDIVCVVLICVWLYRFYLLTAVPNGANTEVCTKQKKKNIFRCLHWHVNFCARIHISMVLCKYLCSRCHCLWSHWPVVSSPVFLSCCFAQRHLGDALTKKAPNECGKWEYQFDELCYSISAINFPVAPPSKMESRMIEPLFRYLILFLGSSLRVSLNVQRGEALRKRELYGRSNFVSGEKIYCILACSVHNTSFGLISSKPILFTSDLAWTELQIEKIISNREGKKDHRFTL